MKLKMSIIGIGLVLLTGCGLGTGDNINDQVRYKVACEEVGGVVFLSLLNVYQCDLTTKTGEVKE